MGKRVLQISLIIVLSMFFVSCIFTGGSENISINRDRDSGAIVNLSIDKKEYIKGQSIEALLEVINNTDSDTLFGSYKGMLINKSTGEEVSSLYIHGNSDRYLTTESNCNIMFIDLTVYVGKIIHKKDEFPFSIPMGEYEYYIYKDNTKNKITETINFEVKEIPEESKEAFAHFWGKEGPTEKIAGYSAWRKILYEKYKGSIYDYEYSKFLISDLYMFLLKKGNEQEKQEAKEFIKSFIRKYSNSQSAIGYYRKFKFEEEKYEIYKELAKEIEQIARTKDAKKLSYGRNILSEVIENNRRN